MAKRGRSLRYASVGDMPESMKRLLGEKAAIAAAKRPELERRTKYGNLPTVVDGIRFDSKKEAAYYGQLKLRKEAGEVLYWLRQVPIHLPGGTRYVIDFLVFFVDRARAPEYVDVKGRETAMFRVKRREVEHHFPFAITLA